MDLNKGISTPIAILLIIAFSAVTGIIVWQLTKPAEQPTPKQPSDYTTQADCEDADYYWYDEACHEAQQPETVDWKTYKNERYGLRFEYPSQFEIEEEKIVQTFDNFNWYRIEISDNEGMSLRVEVNPDGYGPHFPDRYFNLKETSEGELIVKGYEENKTSRFPDQIIFLTKPYESQNGNSYWIQYGHKKGDLEEDTQLFEKILSSFHFSQPEEDTTSSSKQPSDYTTQAACESAGYYWYDDSCHEKELTWQCGDKVSYKGQDYSTVKIGDQCWFAENLNVGTMVEGGQVQTDNSAIEKHCYNDKKENCDTYGGLYQWKEAMQYTEEEETQGVCPEGWHIPTDAEWHVLESHLAQPGSKCEASRPGIHVEMSEWQCKPAGAKMAGNKSLWNDGTLTEHGSFGSSGLNILPAGYKQPNGDPEEDFYTKGERSFLWSSTKIGTSTADRTRISEADAAWGDVWGRTLLWKFQSGVFRDDHDPHMSFSVRCLKD